MVSSENNIVVGLQWGQEGKNRLLDFALRHPPRGEALRYNPRGDP